LTIPSYAKSAACFCAAYGPDVPGTFKPPLLELAAAVGVAVVCALPAAVGVPPTARDPCAELEQPATVSVHAPKNTANNPKRLQRDMAVHPALPV
jgi:hypothetical protein